MFEMQIKVETRKGIFEWVSVHPTGGKPYQYPTKQEAREMLGHLYPDTPTEQMRVIEATPNGNTLRSWDTQTQTTKGAK